MGQGKDDPIPEGLSKSDAYRKVYTWYRSHISEIESKDGKYFKESAEYIRNLKDPDEVREDEIQEVFNQILTGLLEWGYQRSDGQYKMAAYASI